MVVANWRHAAADLLDVLAVGDGAGAHEALLGGALADVVVDRERLAGRDDRAAHEVGHAVDVGDPGSPAGVVGGEATSTCVHALPLDGRADRLLDAQRLGLLRGERRAPRPIDASTRTVDSPSLMAASTAAAASASQQRDAGLARA